MKLLLTVLWKTVWYLVMGVWLVVKWSCKLVWLLLKGVLYLFGMRFTRKMKEPEPLPMVFDDEPRGDEAVIKVGSIVPVEEDANLRTFNILNAEGEIYRINTALPGPFYGTVWTKILGCYETQQTLCGRLVKPLYDQHSGMLTGYVVYIGKVKAFMPAAEVFLAKEHRPINLRLAVTSVDPVSKKVVVSLRRAYHALLGKKNMGEAGQEVEALYWDYDDEFIYLLLPGEYVGQMRCDVTATEAASRMGLFTRCRLESVYQEDQTAIVNLSSNNKLDVITSAAHAQVADARESVKSPGREDSEAIFDLDGEEGAEVAVASKRVGQ
jgi:hypothetical protein